VNPHKTNVIGVTLIRRPARPSIEVRADSLVNPPRPRSAPSRDRSRPAGPARCRWTTTDAESVSIRAGIEMWRYPVRRPSPRRPPQPTPHGGRARRTVTRTATVTVIAPPPTVSLSVSREHLRQEIVSDLELDQRPERRDRTRHRPVAVAGTASDLSFRDHHLHHHRNRGRRNSPGERDGNGLPTPVG
jgi:hypothetical protein